MFTDAWYSYCDSAAHNPTCLQMYKTLRTHHAVGRSQYRIPAIDIACIVRTCTLVRVNACIRVIVHYCQGTCTLVRVYIFWSSCSARIATKNKYFTWLLTWIAHSDCSCRITCTLTRVQACTRVIVHACTWAIVHACASPTHKHIPCPLGLMFHQDCKQKQIFDKIARQDCLPGLQLLDYDYTR